MEAKENKDRTIARRGLLLLQTYQYITLKIKGELLQSDLATGLRATIKLYKAIYRINKRWIIQIADKHGNRTNKFLYRHRIGSKSSSLAI